MPRGSRPGERRGGRQRGTPNKKTLLKNAAIDAAAADPDITPLAFLLRLMRDEGLPIATRVDIAATAAPLFHAKPKPAKEGQRAGREGEPGELQSMVTNVKIALLPKSAPGENLGAEVVSPLEFLQHVMTDPATPPQLRIRSARIAAPFRHGKPIEPVLNTGDMISKDEYGFEVEQRFARKLRELVVAQWRTWYFRNNDEDGEAGGDRYRMLEYCADRISLRPELKLSAEEDARISHACFRFLAFKQTWQGIAGYDHYTMCHIFYRKNQRAAQK